MKFEIKNQLNGSVLFSIETDSFKLAVEAAIKQKIDLRGSDLRGSNLSGSNLSGSNLSGSNLSGSDLSGSNLSGSNLSGSDLSGSNLSGSNLSGSNLSGSNLRGSNLSGSNLSGSNLRGSNLSGSNLPAPTIVLLASWGALTDKLTADLMKLDASGHPDKKAFDKWAKGGACPYSGVKVQRLCNFYENPKLWGKGKLDTIYNLMVRVLREKTKTDL